ncbi:MAG: HAD family phosphatase [Clostridia bacterium]|nr:HAD family phosphatase [Clostridia bacterium]
MPDFKAAIFDLDGTLLDSIWVWEKIDIDFLAKRHLDVPISYGCEVSARSFRESAKYTVALFDLEESVEDIIAEWNRMALDEYSHHIPLKPHAKEYLLYLKAQGIKLGTASALPEALYAPVLKNNGVYGLFDAFCCTDEVPRGKESPDIYLLAAEKLGVAPCDCIAFEDVLPGIRGILSAGMRAYGVYDKYSEHEQEQIRALSQGYIRDFTEMLEQN